MHFVVLILSIWIFTKTLSFGISEIKNHQNKSGGILVIIFATLSLIFPNITVFIVGVY